MSHKFVWYLELPFKHFCLTAFNRQMLPVSHSLSNSTICFSSSAGELKARRLLSYFRLGSVCSACSNVSLHVPDNCPVANKDHRWGWIHWVRAWKGAPFQHFEWPLTPAIQYQIQKLHFLHQTYMFWVTVYTRWLLCPCPLGELCTSIQPISLGPGSSFCSYTNWWTYQLWILFLVL